jgi:hypothetical protein
VLKEEGTHTFTVIKYYQYPLAVNCVYNNIIGIMMHHARRSFSAMVFGPSGPTVVLLRVYYILYTQIVLNLTI